jgi:hypothetical protein
MRLHYRQQCQLRRMHRMLGTSEPRLASMLVTFARLYAGEDLPGREQVRRGLPWPVRALARAVWAAARAGWAVICLCGRALLACSGLLRPCGRPLRPCGRLLRRTAVCCLLTWSFLPAGFRLTVGAWLVVHHPPASVPPTAHRRNR